MKTKYEALIKRELLEYKGTIIQAPLVLTSIYLAVWFLALVIVLPFAGPAFLADDEGSHHKFNFDTHHLPSVFAAIGALVAFFYLLDCLYSDRKDRSILFWRSMPVSEYENVAAKLLTSVFTIPTVWYLIGAIGSYINALMIFVATKFTGLNVVKLHWNLLGEHPMGVVTDYLSIILISLNFLPVHLLALAVSAYVKRAPFVMLMLGFICVSFIEFLIFRHFYIMKFFSNFCYHAVSAGVALGHGRWEYSIVGIVATLLVSAGMYVGVVWLRKYRFEI